MGLAELGAELAETLTPRGLTLALAESCTGGLIADTITNVPGSSDFFLGSVVAYANAAKENLLGVPAATLSEHGAVSEAVALAMARGARRALGADLGLGITGIAGPAGATPSKPVGLVYLALAGPAGERVVRFQAQGDRVANKRRFAEEALSALLAYIRAGNGEV